MTKITVYNKGIIIDGHANTKEECETITLLCDSLAKDNNFKQIAYDKGYAAFKKVGKTNNLMFDSEGYSTVINWDSGVNSVSVVDDSGTKTWTSSGQSVETTGMGGTTYTFNVILKNGYIIDNVTAINADQYSILQHTDNKITVQTSSSGLGSGFTITTVMRKSYDLSTSAKWATLSSGNHNVQIVAKASGYRDSEKSAAAVVKKEYPNVTLAKGSYKFFTNMTLPSTTWQVEMPFTSNNVSYSQLQVYGTDQIVLNRGIWYNTNHACVGAEWDDDTYQIITLSADAQVPSDFLTWFNANTSPCIEAGTYQFAEIIRMFPSNQTIDFTSNGNSYSQFTFPSLGMNYAKASSTLVYVKSTETWENQAFRIVTFATTQVCSSTFFTWFKMYASVYTATI